MLLWKILRVYLLSPWLSMLFLLKLVELIWYFLLTVLCYDRVTLLFIEIDIVFAATILKKKKKGERKGKKQGGCWITHFSNYDFVINDPHYEVEIEVAQYFIFSSVNDENSYLSLSVSKRTINRHLMGACKLQGKISNKYNYTYYWREKEYTNDLKPRSILSHYYGY